MDFWRARNLSEISQHLKNALPFSRGIFIELRKHYKGYYFVRLVMHKNYYEGILQLRNPDKEIIEFIRNEVKRRPSVFISKEEPEGDGIDFYMNSQHFLQNLGKRLQQKFGGELIVSHRNYSKSRQTSKSLYRINVLFRIPAFKKGDIIKVRGEEVEVLNIGRKVFGRYVKSGRKVQLNYKDI